MDELTDKQKDIKSRLNQEDDLIYSSKYDHSLKKAMYNNPQGLTNDKIARMLLTTEEDVVRIYHRAIKKLKKIMTFEG